MYRPKKKNSKNCNTPDLAKVLLPFFGDQGCIWEHVTTLRRELTGDTLDALTTDPALLRNHLIRVLHHKRMTDLAKSIKHFRDLRNKLVHNNFFDISFLRHVLLRVQSFCTWMRQYNSTTANVFSQNDITALASGAYVLARSVGIELPNTPASNVTLTQDPNSLRSNTNRSVPSQSFINAGDPQLNSASESNEENSSFESDNEEDSTSRASKVPARPNNNNNNNDLLIDEDENPFDSDDEMQSFEEIYEEPVVVIRTPTAPSRCSSVIVSPSVPTPITKPQVVPTPSRTNEAPLAPTTPLPIPITVLPGERPGGHPFLRIPRASPAPAPQQPQRAVVHPPQPQHQVQVPNVAANRVPINQVPNYKAALRGRTCRVMTGRFQGANVLFIRPNGNNFVVRCVETGQEHFLTLTTEIELQAPEVPIPAVVLQQMPPNNNNNVVGPAVPPPQAQPQQGPPPVQPHGEITTAAVVKQTASQLVKGKTLILRSGKYVNSTGVFLNWNGNNWRWRCHGGQRCDRCANEPTFKHASPNDTEIEVFW